MKFFDIIGSATSNMMRSKMRTILTVTAIVIGSFTITLTVGISSGISDFIDKQLGSIGADDVLIVQQHVDFSSTSDGPTKYDPKSASTSGRASFTTPSITTEDINDIKATPGIISAKPSIVVSPDYIQGANNDKYVLSTQEVVDSANFQYDAGKIPSDSATNNQILIPADYVSPLGFSSAADAVGKSITLGVSNPLAVQHTVKATIVGVQQASILSQGGATINKSLVDALRSYQTEGLPASATDKYFAAVAKFDPSDPAKLQSIKDALTKKGFDATTVKDQIGILKQVIDAITYVLLFFGAIALLAASFGIVNTLFMSVQERTKEIGLMKAMGMRRSKVFLLFSVEAILLGFWGSVIGIGLALIVGNIANVIATENFLKDLPGFDLTVFPIISLAVIMLVIMLIALLSGTLPARRAARQDAIEALRYE
ncbi:MAG: FtsX-like permease family protein [Candidatus Saccharimonadales bacterium]